MSGWIKHLLIALGLFLAVIAYLLIQNWATFVMMYDNMTAMNEGAELADQIRFPEDLVGYIAEHPGSVSLVAYDVDEEAGGIYFRPDQPRTISGVSALTVLSTYAHQVESGELDPEVRLPLDSVVVYALPNAGAAAHERARSLAFDAGEVDADSSVALRDLATWVATRNDHAATDWFIQQLGREEIAATAVRLGLEDSDPPLPTSGLFLSWRRGADEASPSEHLLALEALPRSAYADTVYALTSRLARDVTFAKQERARLEERGPELTLREQRALAKTTYPKATTRDYAQLMERVAMTEPDGDEPEARFLREKIERRVDSDSLAVTVEAVGSKGGAMPGLLSLVGYAYPTDGGPPRVAALFIEDLPMAVFYHLAQTGMDKGFLIQLLGDDEFFANARRALDEG